MRLETSDSGRDIDLRAAGAILILSCYELGHQPMGLALPAAALRQAGYRPATCDLAVESLDESLVGAARMVAISAPMHTALRMAVRLTHQIRSTNPGCVICLFGLYASLNEEHLLESGIDACVGGEYVEGLVAYVEALERRSPAPSGVSVPGLFRRPSTVPGPMIVPDRTKLPSLDRYARLEFAEESAIVGYVEATRGCQHQCAHCPIPPVYGGRLSVIDRGVVLEDIATQFDLGARHITFGDPDFFNGPGHSMRILREMHRSWPGLTFDCTIKIQHLLERRDLLPELADLGCAFVVSAVESLSEQVLGILRKEHTAGDVRRATELLQKSGLVLRPTWLPFTPWASMPDYLEIFEYLSEYDLVDHVDPVQLTIRLLLPPGSLLLDHPQMQPHLGELQKDSLSYDWKHPDPMMDDLQKQVTRRVEFAAAEGEEPEQTFYELWHLAARSTGRAGPRKPALHRRKRAPRLTEPWFC